MGNVVPKLMGCGSAYNKRPPYEEEEEEEAVPRTLDPCCMVYKGGRNSPENCLRHLKRLKALPQLPCTHCCVQLPYVLRRILQGAEEDPSLTVPYALELFYILDGGWGIALDTRIHTRMTLDYCEWIEECWFRTQAETSNVFVVVTLIGEGLHARYARGVVVRALWKEHQQCRATMRRTFMLAGCAMQRYGVPRDIRKIIYRQAGAYSHASWHAWSGRLESLRFLWDSRADAMRARSAAQYALEHALYTRFSKVDPSHGHERYARVIEIIEDTSQLHSRDAWLHWVQTKAKFVRRENFEFSSE
jgi:hypothetical protein